MADSIQKQLQFLMYSTPDEDVNVPAISKHLKNIFEEGELQESTIISVGYRISSASTKFSMVKGKFLTNRLNERPLQSMAFSTRPKRLSLTSTNWSRK